MSERYAVKLAEMAAPDHLIQGIGAGNFSLSFVVEPPVRFHSQTAPLELAQQVLDNINILGTQHYDPTGEEMGSANGIVSFTHDLPDDTGTVGNFRGHALSPVHTGIVLRALDLALNGTPE